MASQDSIQQRYLLAYISSWSYTSYSPTARALNKTKSLSKKNIESSQRLDTFVQDKEDGFTNNTKNKPTTPYNEAKNKDVDELMKDLTDMKIVNEAKDAWKNKD
jgi:hypothetical protein